MNRHRTNKHKLRNRRYRKNRDYSDTESSSNSSNSDSDSDYEDRSDEEKCREKKVKSKTSKRKYFYSSDSNDSSSEDSDNPEDDKVIPNHYNTPINKPILFINEEDNRMFKLFNSVFGNMVLSTKIFNYSRLYKKNEDVKIFKTIESLKEYPEKEYLQSILYKGYGKLKYGDLPISGVLKEVELTQDVIDKGEIIPYGVEILKLSAMISLDISTLPKTIHSLYGTPVQKNKDCIPPNITSISFKGCPNLSNENDDGFIVIPNTIRNLILYNSNATTPLRPGDIPYGVTRLEGNVRFNEGVLPESLTEIKIDNYDIEKVSKLVLPNSLKHLEIHCFYGIGDNTSGFLFLGPGKGPKKDCSNGLFNFVPPNLESLIFQCESNITPHSNLSKCKSIKKLSLLLKHAFHSAGNTIEPNSLPSSLNELEIFNISGTLEVNVIPKNVKILKLYELESNEFKISKGAIPNSVTSINLRSAIRKRNILPNSLTHLELVPNFSISTSDKSIQRMIDILPRSLTSISLPIKFKQFYKDIPSRIKIITKPKLTF